MKRWFLTVDWCDKGNRGVFCDEQGNAFPKDTKHDKDDIWKILDCFCMVLSPESLELSEEELKEYHLYRPLEEYSNQYGVACKS